MVIGITLKATTLEDDFASTSSFKFLLGGYDELVK